MTNIEIRHEIMQRLFSVEDKNLLRRILELLPVGQSKSVDWWDDLSEVDRQLIEDSAAAADRGEVVAHESVITNVGALLSKRQAP